MIYIVLLYSADVIYTLYIQAIYIYIRTVSTAKQCSTCIYVCLYFPAIAFVCSLSSVKTAIDLIIYCNYLIDNLRIMDSVHSFVASLGPETAHSCQHVLLFVFISDDRRFQISVAVHFIQKDQPVILQPLSSWVEIEFHQTVSRHFNDARPTLPQPNHRWKKGRLKKRWRFRLVSKIWSSSWLFPALGGQFWVGEHGYGQGSVKQNMGMQKHYRLMSCAALGDGEKPLSSMLNHLSWNLTLED